ncbi:hypothetical protein L7F22_040423 [Adiantum nelumboides]|nr:hypothetical protein [Adiantum nelumboides]
MMLIRSMKMAMEELFQSRWQEEPVEVESDDFESKSYQGSGKIAMEAFDPNEEETQWNMIKEGKEVITRDVRLTSKLVFEVFKIPYLSVPAKGRKVTDSQLKGNFGKWIGAKSYYMVRNAGGFRAASLFWYLEKARILQKTAYMSKEAFAPLYQAEQGVKVDWAIVLYDWMQLIGKRDRCWTPAVGRVTPYLAAIFEHVLAPTALGLKTSTAATLMEEGTISGKFKKSESKGKKITLFSMGIVGFAWKSVPESLLAKEGSSASHGAMGILSAKEATNSLIDLSNMQLLQEKSAKENLQEEVTRLTTEGKAMTPEILSVAEDFQQWFNGLKIAVYEQFKELDEKVAAMITENVLLIKRSSPLAEIEKDSLKRENEALKIENERLVAEMKEMRNNRKEIEDNLSKLKADLSSGLLEPDQNLAMEAESDVEKQANVNFVAEKAVETDAKGDIGEQTTWSRDYGPRWVLDSSSVWPPNRSPPSDSSSSHHDRANTTQLMIKQDKLQQLKKSNVKGKFVMDNVINPSLIYFTPTSQSMLKNETFQSLTDDSVLAIQTGWNTIVNGISQMMEAASRALEAYKQELDTDKQQTARLLKVKNEMELKLKMKDQLVQVQEQQLQNVEEQNAAKVKRYGDSVVECTTS